MSILDLQTQPRLPARTDVVIVGAGAAGCACALALLAGASALLVDRSRPGRGRCCGGLLAPDAQSALRDLRLELPAEVRVRPEPHRVHAVDLESGREQTYARGYWNVDRAAFDHWLLGLAAARVETALATAFVAARPEPGGWLVRLRLPGGERDVRCGWLVGADGANSTVRRTMLPGVAPVPTAIAVQARLARARLHDHEVLFSPRLTDFYAWAIPKPDCVLVGTAFGDPRRARARFAAVLAEFASSLGLDPVPLETRAHPLGRPSGAAQLCPGTGRLLLAGEAAGLVSPSSGEGLSFALGSGREAGRALAAPDPAAAWRRRSRFQRLRVIARLPRARVILTPALRRLALRLRWCP